MCSGVAFCHSPDLNGEVGAQFSSSLMFSFMAVMPLLLAGREAVSLFFLRTEKGMINRHGI